MEDEKAEETVKARVAAVSSLVCFVLMWAVVLCCVIAVVLCCAIAVMLCCAIAVVLCRAIAVVLCCAIAVLFVSAGRYGAPAPSGSSRRAKSWSVIWSS